MGSPFQSWGHYPQTPQEGIYIEDRYQTLPQSSGFILPFGNGRSYGDSCLNDKGLVYSSRRLNHFIAFDREQGIIRCEAGVLFSEILETIVPKGWFLPVTPGTKYITVGGAIANDVHGKNHHVAGTFGSHLSQFELLRSDGQRLICSPSDNSNFYAATIGGLGLTGFITWAEFRLKKIKNTAIAMESIKFQRLDDFFNLSEESDNDYEYTMSWVDCTAKGTQLGRGHFLRGNHAYEIIQEPKKKRRHISVPFIPPVSLINKFSLRVFNNLYYHRQRKPRVKSVIYYEPFFYPLDSILNWNRIYGPKGFLQYQCVLPRAHSRDGIREILERISHSKFGSVLAVLKICGNISSPGLLSFPMPGASLALDFPYVKNKTLPLFATLDSVVSNAGGRIYPAKDAHMDAPLFEKCYPQWRELLEYKDPKFSSSFWRRVSEGAE